MRRCTSCGTRLSHEADRCWLCHAGTPPPELDLVEEEEEEVATNADHVMGGPLARASHHGDHPDPIAARLYSRWQSEAGALGSRGRLLIALLVTVTVLGVSGMLAPVGVASLAAGVGAGCLTLWLMNHTWARHRTAG
jgi:hypothetical protein